MFMLLIKISLRFNPESPPDNESSLVQGLAWHQPGTKPLHEPMMIQFIDLCVTLNMIKFVKFLLCVLYIVFIIAVTAFMVTSLAYGLNHMLSDSKEYWVHYSAWTQVPSVSEIVLEDIVNPLCSKFFRVNINMYLHFMSFLRTVTQVVEIPPRVRQGPAYST